MTSCRTLLSTGALALAATAILLTGFASSAHASVECRGLGRTCAASDSCVPFIDQYGPGYRCTTTYVYYGRVLEE